MNNLETDVLIIGGGITGLGIARDAAMRGFRIVLLEREELGSGTSGYFHETLHSGARYAVTDPVSAKECFTENIILKRILKSAIQETGGLSIAIEKDDLKYSEKLYKACKDLSIFIEELSPAQTLKREPQMTPRLVRAFLLADGHIDGKKAIALTKNSVKELGVEVYTHHEVIRLQKNKVIEAVIVQDKKTGDQKTISGSFVINAAGVWAGKIALLAGITIPLIADKGAMVVVKDHPVKSVVNWCRMPSDGDLIVPSDAGCILGTTSTQTTDLDTHNVEQWEIDKLMTVGDQMIPGLAASKIVRAFAGVRPLYFPDSHSEDSRSVSRSFQVINHKTSDDISNFISIVGGKFTIHRLMAERVVDEMCHNLGVKKSCRTASVPVD